MKILKYCLIILLSLTSASVACPNESITFADSNTYCYDEDEQVSDNISFQNESIEVSKKELYPEGSVSTNIIGEHFVASNPLDYIQLNLYNNFILTIANAELQDENGNEVSSESDPNFYQTVGYVGYQKLDDNNELDYQIITDEVYTQVATDENGDLSYSFPFILTVDGNSYTGEFAADMHEDDDWVFEDNNVTRLGGSKSIMSIKWCFESGDIGIYNNDTKQWINVDSEPDCN